ncbi:MAG: hypothetical protein HY695_08065 [Deltaproteobacteria bacterium]|nr:hypothetical protein [Deltaproteobacteria bacterium]
MRRVVVTGMGIVSPIGNSKSEVLRSLRESISGIEFIPEMKDMGLRCHVAGRIKNLDTAKVGKRRLQTMSNVARYAAVAGLEALDDANLPRDLLSSPRIGVVVGAAISGISETLRVEEQLLARTDVSRIGATGAVKIMNSSAAVNLATSLGIKGRCYSISSGCATGTDSIGHAFELIRHGILDVCFCGGAEEFCTLTIAYLDNLGLVPYGFNDRSQKAYRPFDEERQGAALSEGAGILVLEDFDYATSRGAKTYGEVVGYGSANGGLDVFEPTGLGGIGLRTAIEQALDLAKRHPIDIDYINPHGAATRGGDAAEIQIIREMFRDRPPLVSSTKSLSGYPQGAAGAHDSIHTLLMLHDSFIAPTVNLDRIAPECQGVRHVQSLAETRVETAMTFNYGLGGTNACLIFTKV